MHRRKLLAIAALLAVASLLAPAATLAAGSLKLRTGTVVEDLAEAPDGTVRVLTKDWLLDSSRGDVLRVHRLGEAGELGRARKVSRGPLAFSGALLPAGGAVLLREPTIDRTRHRPDVYTVTDAGQISSRATRIADRRTSLLGPSVGPTGALLVRAGRSSKRTASTGFYFRAAGAPAFGGLQVLSSARAADPRDDPDGDGFDTNFEYAFAPDGGAAVLALPDAAKFGAAYVRRISPAGVLGPQIPLGVAPANILGGTLAFGPTGQLIVAVAAVDDRGDTDVGASYVTTIAPGATTAAAPQRLADADRVTAYSDLLGIATDGDRVLVAAGAMDGEVTTTLRTFTSQGGSAFEESAPAIDAPSVRNLEAFAWPGGLTALVWDRITHLGSVEDGAYAATRAFDAATYGAPRMLTRRLAVDAYRELDALLPLSGGRLALAYRDYAGSDGPTTVAIVRP